MTARTAERVAAERAALSRAAARFTALRLAGVRQVDLSRIRKLDAACRTLVNLCDEVFNVDGVEHPSEVGVASIEAVEVLAALGLHSAGWPAYGVLIARLMAEAQKLGAAAAEAERRPAVAEPLYRWVACAADEWSRSGLGRIGHGADARFSQALHAFDDSHTPKPGSAAQLRSAITAWRSSVVQSAA